MGVSGNHDDSDTRFGLRNIVALISALQRVRTTVDYVLWYLAGSGERNEPFVLRKRIILCNV